MLLDIVNDVKECVFINKQQMFESKLKERLNEGFKVYTEKLEKDYAYYVENIEKDALRYCKALNRRSKGEYRREGEYTYNNSRRVIK